MEKVYNKLVRDKIPTIIKEDGRKCTLRILANEEYRQELNTKLKEEVNEYITDNNVEELADIVEVIYGILDSMEVSREEFEKIRMQKVEKVKDFKGTTKKLIKNIIIKIMFFVFISISYEKISLGSTEFVEKSLSTHMDLDLDVMRKKSNENPVFYAQYAYARVASVFRKFEENNKYYKWDILTKTWNEEKIIDPIHFSPREDILYFNTETKLFYRWDEKDKKFVNVQLALNTLITTTDWRSELFLSGMVSEPYGINSNYYYTELVNEWPKLYDIVQGDFKSEVKNNIESIDYFLDFIDSDGALSELNISNIGRRTKVIVDNDINCLFEPNVPNYILLNTDSDDFHELKNECNERGEEYIQVSEEIFNNTANGGSFNSAYNMVRELLYQYNGVVSFDKVNFSQAVNATFTTFANVGLCFDISNFADFSILSKIVLSIGMLLGRLEILPMMVLFSDLKK